MSTPEVDALAASLRRALSGRADVHVAFLFGSRARGAARADSDVDVAVLAPGVDLLDLAAELGRALGVEVDVVSLDDPPIPLLEQIVDQAILAHEGHPGAAAAWRSGVLLMLETDRPWYARMRDAWLHRVAERGL